MARSGTIMICVKMADLLSVDVNSRIKGKDLIAFIIIKEI
jgi:hypothetical protein